METLAHVDTLCLDKTGTLTQGKMQVEKVYYPEPRRSVAFEKLMGSFLRYSDGNNATFQALKAYFKSNTAFSPVRKIPFSSERKWSAIEFENVGTFVVGAPERLGATLPAHLQGHEQAGKRILMAGLAKDAAESDGPLPAVQKFAYIVISDPIRPNAAETLAYFRKEGVDLKLISGDNTATVSALAKQAGFPQAERYIDMSGITRETEIEKAALSYLVFCRVSPLQKKQLVQALQKNDRSVAMTVKRRLFVSNILMLLIPAVLAIIVLMGCMFILLILKFPHAEEYQLGFEGELTEMRYEAAALAADWLSEADPDRKARIEADLSELAQEDQIFLKIYQGENLIRQFGDKAVPAQSQLEQSLAVLNGEGTVSDGSFDLYGQ